VAAGDHRGRVGDRGARGHAGRHVAADALLREAAAAGDRSGERLGPEPGLIGLWCPCDRRVAVDGEEQGAASAVGRRQASVVARLADGAGHLGEQLNRTRHGRREADPPGCDVEPLDGREGRPAGQRP
jgi:hypothetical protein